MDQPIIVRYRWTADEFVAVNTLIRRRAWLMRPFFRVLLLVMILFGLFSIGFSVYQRSWGLLAMLVAVGIVVATNKPLNVWGWRRQFKKQPAEDTGIEIQFTPSLISSNTELGKSELVWDAFIEVVEAKNGFLLFVTPQICNWLPIHSFQNDSDITAFKTLAKSKVKKYTLMK